MDTEQPNTSETSTVIASTKKWPGAFGVYKDSKAAIMLNLVPIVELLLINIVANIVLRFIPFIGWIASLLISVFVATCVYQLYLAGVNGKTLDLSKVIDGSKRIYLNMLLAIVLIWLTCLSFLLLIIPGLILVPRIIMTPYFVIDKKLDAIEAYKASWHATKGHVGKIYGIIGVTVLMILPSITIIGILLTIYWVVLYSAASAILYKYITNKAK